MNGFTITRDDRFHRYTVTHLNCKPMTFIACFSHYGRPKLAEAAANQFVASYVLLEKCKKAQALLNDPELDEIIETLETLKKQAFIERAEPVEVNYHNPLANSKFFGKI